jgi:hypothetical protein
MAIQHPILVQLAVSPSKVKEANPVEIAEYVIANTIASEPAFAWWVRFMIQKRDQIIAAVNKRYF